MANDRQRGLARMDDTCVHVVCVCPVIIDVYLSMGAPKTWVWPLASFSTIVIICISTGSLVPPAFLDQKVYALASKTCHAARQDMCLASG